MYRTISDSVIIDIILSKAHKTLQKKPSPKNAQKKLMLTFQQFNYISASQSTNKVNQIRPAKVVTVTYWTSEECFMYVQFKTCVQWDMQIIDSKKYKLLD